MRWEDDHLLWTGFTYSTGPAVQHLKRRIPVRPWVWWQRTGRWPTSSVINTCGRKDCLSHIIPRDETPFCKRGHPLSGDNLKFYGKDKDRRRCYQCTLDRQKTDRARALKRLRDSTVYVERRKRNAAARTTKRTWVGRIDRGVAHWSPTASRWLVWDAGRWIKTTDDGALEAVRRYLRKNKLDYVGSDIMTHLKRLACQRFTEAIPAG